MTKQKKKSKKLFLLIAGIIGIFFLLFFFFAARMVFSITPPDKQCTTPHTASSTPPSKLETANDYFLRGNYNYELGKCENAVTDYTKAIEMKNNFAEAYNNRAYTYMRMQRYADALPDLDTAIKLRPDYVNALMNRGDIYNYYYAIDRKKAVKDYDRVLQLVPPEKYRELSLCGHRLLAQNGGWRPAVFFTLLIKGYNAGCK